MQPRLLREPVRLAGAPLLRLQSDDRLVALAREGYEPAFATIVRRYEAGLQRYCTRLVGPDRAEDAVQQAFVNAHRALTEHDEEVQLRPWLYRIAHNTALNTLRSARDDAPLDEAIATATIDEIDRGEARDHLRRTLRTIAGLPPRQRDALVLRELEGRSHEEIATTLGVTEGSARQHLMRARAAVRAAVTSVTPFPFAERIALTLMDQPAAGRAAGLVAGGVFAKVAAGVLATGAVAGGAVGVVDLAGTAPAARATDRGAALARSEPRTTTTSAAGGGVVVGVDDHGRRATADDSARGRRGARARRHDGSEHDRRGRSGTTSGRRDGRPGKGSSGDEPGRNGASGGRDGDDDHGSSGKGSSGSGSSGSGSHDVSQSGEPGDDHRGSQKSGSSHGGSSGSGSSGSPEPDDSSHGDSSGSRPSHSGSSSGGGSDDLAAPDPTPGGPQPEPSGGRPERSGSGGSKTTETPTTTTTDATTTTEPTSKDTSLGAAQLDAPARPGD